MVKGMRGLLLTTVHIFSSVCQISDPSVCLFEQYCPPGVSLHRRDEQAEKLPLKYQDMIAEKILEEIEEAQWDEWLARPDIAEMLDNSAEEAKAEQLAGKTIKYVQGKSLAELFQ